MNNVDNNSRWITPPCVHNFSASVISDFSAISGIHSLTDLGNSDAAAFPAGGDNLVENLEQGLDNTFIFQIYVGAEEFVGKNDVKYPQVSQVLKKIRLRNVNRVII